MIVLGAIFYRAYVVKGAMITVLVQTTIDVSLYGG